MKISVLLFCLFLGTGLVAQEDNIQQILREGIALHDQGDYENALKKYDEALAIKKDHFTANYEKSMTLLYMKRYDECIDICKYLLQLDPDNKTNKSVYVNYGSALDDQGNVKGALKVFDKGIKKYPDFYLLYYNKGLTLYKTGREDDAMEAIQSGLQHNPLHASAHNMMAVMLKSTDKIAALLPTLVFLAIEPRGERATTNVQRMEASLNSNVKKEDGKNVTIFLSADALSKKNKKKENNFSSVDLIVSLAGSMDYDEKFKDETPPVRLNRKLVLLISSLRNSQKSGRGFCWKFYAPFLDELEKKGHLPVYSHIAYFSLDDENNRQWLQENETALKDFYTWLKEYKWGK